MQNFVTFWGEMFSLVADFLMSEPVIWFVGLFILIVIAGFITKIIR